MFKIGITILKSYLQKFESNKEKRFGRNKPNKIANCFKISEEEAKVRQKDSDYNRNRSVLQLQ